MSNYSTQITWTGNSGQGTAGYKTYDRSYTIEAPNKPILEGSSDPAFRGDAAKYNPEELLVASLASCHMLWFLHVCADNKVIVTNYLDNAQGIMQKDADGIIRFKEVNLKPVVTVREMISEALYMKLHRQANAECFIANSVNFPVNHEPVLNVEA